MIVILDYNAGNTQSVKHAINRLGYSCKLSKDLNEIQQADKIIFPGVGQASVAMKELKLTGLDKLLPKLEQPVLGICLGLQLMCEHSEENDTQGLGIFPTSVKRFTAQLPVPHMGWNCLQFNNKSILNKVKPSVYFYFVHSYYAELCDFTQATATYDRSFSAVLQKNNFYATQFHPEKSGIAGEQILKNFLSL
ncbi:imidazole glycerol phosphate synthase subunit HisH [uncultured Mesonia sp.]|uniref:imidazole glycerol phosphate synthase subunit HisH n=1 Tax=uncultured Mesonia sp. TaxID=399731 RepID=UPI00374E7BC2